MSFSAFVSMLLPARVATLPQPSGPSPVLHAMRAVGDYADALSNGLPVDEVALSYARCVLEHGAGACHQAHASEPS